MPARDNAEGVEFDDMDLADKFVGMPPAHGRRDGQEPSGLEQHRRGQSQEEPGQRHKEQPPD
eukprot:CAMPEP_0184430772 /NCGR_PEP_ID=MMETSP0738-20130409/286546_1 /TAXON_ID=385413 /ORGANISM="Thalassiosira miniscula, Strain CCMP1093" /LENGTH=61 /DNA_ID=CAMNT_0026795457 /DNA_START=183 /DNA_END=365 /DNA_ORIENTATION=+